MTTIRLMALAILLLCSLELNAQQAPVRDSVAVDTISTVQDRPTFQPTLPIQTDGTNAEITFDAKDADGEPEITPGGAVWRSIVLPGWGQYYVEDYWKVPVVLGAAGFFTYRIIDNNTKFNDAKDQIAGLDEDDSRLFLLRRERELYRDRRDEAGLYLLLTYLVATLDAYVGAHLFYFDVSDDLGAQLHYAPQVNGLGLRLNF